MSVATPDQEEHRHQCEVRMLLRMRVERGRASVQEYLDDWRVKGRRERLRADVNAQWALGNKGDTDEWL